MAEKNYELRGEKRTNDKKKTSEENNLNHLLEDYGTEAVPKEKQKNWLSMALVWAGVAISLGLIMTGSTIGNGLNFKSTVIASLIGGIVLAIVTSLTGIIGARINLSTAMISKFTFGKVAIILVAIIQAFGSFGWFGVQLGLFGETATSAWNMAFGTIVSPKIMIIIGGICMLFTSTIGYKGVDLLSKLAVPLLIVLMAGSVYKAMQTTSFAEIMVMKPAGTAITVGYGISLVVSSFIVGAVMGPDVSRYGRSPKDTVIAAGLAFIIVVPFTLIVGCVLSLTTGTWDIVTIMIRLGWGLMAMLLLLLAQWTSNDSNLYGASLGFAVVFKKLKRYQLNLISGVVGILLALSGIYNNFVTFLNYLGIFIPAMGGVILSDYYIFHKLAYSMENLGTLPKCNVPACGAWLIGSAITAITTYTSVTLTTAPAVDGIIGAFIAHFIWNKCISKEVIN